MRFAYSRWVGLLAGIFLFEIPCAAIESASLQDMLGAHLDRVMRKSGILLPTRHGEPVTNWFGRVVMEGADALPAGLNYIQLRDSDLAARVREELRFPRDPQDEFRLPDIGWKGDSPPFQKKINSKRRRIVDVLSFVNGDGLRRASPISASLQSGRRSVDLGSGPRFVSRCNERRAQSHKYEI